MSESAGNLGHPDGLTPQELQAEIDLLTRLSKRQSQVMVADDMQSMRLLLTQVLKALGFAKIVRAADGEQGLNLLASQPCDLALVDWNMPIVDGLRLLDQVRDHPTLRRMVFILVTGENLSERVMQAAEERQDAYLTKPVSVEKLSRRLALVIERRSTQARAWLLYAQGLPERALETLLEAAANRPGLRWPYFTAGALLARQGRREEAWRCYDKVLAMDPQAVGAMVAQGRLREEEGRLDEARALYRQAIAKSPNFFKGYDTLAESFLAQGQAKEAWQVLNQAVQSAGGGHNAARQEKLGRLSLDLGLFEQAVASLSQALRLKPAAFRGEGGLLLGRALLLAGQPQEALAPLEEAIAAPSPGLPYLPRMALLLLARAHLELNQPPAACRRLAQLRGLLGPVAGDALQQPQEAAWREEALAQLSWAARLGLERSLWPLVTELAPLLVALGRTKDAQALLDKALSLSPQHPDLKKAKAALGNG